MQWMQKVDNISQIGYWALLVFCFLEEQMLLVVLGNNSGSL